MPGTPFTLEVRPRIPSNLARLEELANNLFYSWDRHVRGLFLRLDLQLWDECKHNPKLFLRLVSQEKLQRAAEDPIYLQEYIRVVSTFDAYLDSKPNKELSSYLDLGEDLVSYSCAEFGLHESLPIYSGGLGILAGDHCKASSDLGLPFVAFGMLYRLGYFNQQIDGDGKQIALYNTTEFDHLPITPALDDEGNELKVHIDVPGRKIYLRIWNAQIGHVMLHLLDSDLEENSSDDRRITYQLYGGDSTNRLLQDMVLGIGGTRAHRALGYNPSVWHINEGHGALQILERCRELVANGVSFEAALEAIASATVFTTHTPVPAGHDIFDHNLMQHYFSEYVLELGIDMDRLLALGSSPINPHGFNMTSLSLRGSRFHNGVSLIHGRVAAEMERFIWPQVLPEENPIRHVTNGVHLLTFLAHEWASQFDLQFGGGWRVEITNNNFWQRIGDIPNHSFWSVRQTLKTKMFESVHERAVKQYRRNGCSESQIRRLTKFLKPTQSDVLTIGFARRFATYKRATLIFSDMERLARIVNNPDQPVVIIFAGKAHPYDHPGQEFIRRISEISRMPEFEGKIILLEDYDISIARKLVTGVDIWLNNPAYPLEASGTSGQKAGINGVLNLSVLDGWWGEGFNGNNGWAITPHGDKFSEEFRDREEATELLDVIEYEAVPMYYDRDGHGYSVDWIKMSKNAMSSFIPVFNSQRMVLEYVSGFYSHAARQGRIFANDDYSEAKDIALWKEKVSEAWPHITIERLDEPKAQVYRDEAMTIRIAVDLQALNPQDILVDCLVGVSRDDDNLFNRDSCYSVPFVEHLPDGRALFELELTPPKPGKQIYMIRIYPYHENLCQRFETGCMRWL